MELYLVVKKIHVFSVLLSFGLFLFRGGLVLGGSRWAGNPFVRFTPHVVDTVLLASALFLVSLLHQYPFVHGWLTVKVLALVAYVVFGSLALKRARTQRARLIFFALAVITFGFIVSVARAHHPLGILLQFH